MVFIPGLSSALRSTGRRRRHQGQYAITVVSSGALYEPRKATWKHPDPSTLGINYSDARWGWRVSRVKLEKWNIRFNIWNKKHPSFLGAGEFEGVGHKALRSTKSMKTPQIPASSHTIAAAGPLRRPLLFLFFVARIVWTTF